MAGATLVYDDDCGFCTWWVRFVAARSDLRVVGFSEFEGRGGNEALDGNDSSDGNDDLGAVRARLPEDYRACSHLLTDDAVYSCGASVEEALVRAEVCKGLDLSGAVDFLRTFEDYNRARETGYRWVADNRGLLGRVLSADSVFGEDGAE